MTSFRQALHVMGKDLRESRYVLGAYLAITALATLAAVKPDWLNAGTGTSAGVLLLPVVGMIVVASLVQGDSPTRADAFWASRPLNPSAVLAAKIMLTIAIVVAIPLLGQIAALVARQTDSGILTETVAVSAWTYTKWLTVAFLAAAMTRDLKTFVLTIAAVPLIILALIAWTITRSRGTAVGFLIGSRTDYYASWSVIAAGAAGCAALLLYLYRTRDARPRTWVAGLACVFLIMQTPGERPPRAEVTDTQAPVARTTFTIATARFIGRSQSGKPVYPLELTADSVPQLQRLTLVSGSAIVRGRSGSTAHQILDRSRFGLSLWSTAHALTDVTWLRERAIRVGSIAFGLDETDSLRSIVNDGVADVQIDGRILVRIPGPADTLELRPGSSVARNGSTVTISKWSFADGGATLLLAESSLPANFDPFWSRGDQTEFALVNERRHEAVVLNNQGGGSTGGWLVLPGVQVSTGELTYKTPLSRPEEDSTMITDDWFRDAHLVISHWVSLGSYPIHAENSNPTQPPPRR